MSDKRKINKDYVDPTFEKLLHDLERKRVRHNLSPAFTRPAYAYTKAEVGGIGDVVSLV